MRDAALEKAAASNSASRDCESRNQSVAHNSAASETAKIDSVIGVDCRYSMFGFSANSKAAANPALGDARARRAAAKRNDPARMKHADEGIVPASPLPHHASRFANRSMIR